MIQRLAGEGGATRSPCASTQLPFARAIRGARGDPHRTVPLAVLRVWASPPRAAVARLTSAHSLSLVPHLSSEDPRPLRPTARPVADTRGGRPAHTSWG